MIRPRACYFGAGPRREERGGGVARLQIRVTPARASRNRAAAPSRRSGAPEGMPQRQRVRLAEGCNLPRRGHDRAHVLDRAVLAAIREGVLQLKGVIEVILDGGFAAPGDEDKILDTGGTGFVDGVLHQRLVHHGQHFLWHGLGRRKEPGTQPTYRKDCGLDRT